MYCLYSFEYLSCGLFEGISLNFMFLSFNLKFIINCPVFILSFFKKGSCHGSLCHMYEVNFSACWKGRRSCDLKVNQLGVLYRNILYMQVKMSILNVLNTFFFFSLWIQQIKLGGNDESTIAESPQIWQRWQACILNSYSWINTLFQNI